MHDNCNIRATEKIMNGRHLALLAAIGMTAACTALDIENTPPVAVATLVTPIGELGYIELNNGDSATVELSGAASTDLDGTVASHYWRRTDITRAERFGIGDAGMPSGDLFDPGPGASKTLTLPQGTYRYSLWVTDDDGAVSEPSSISMQVGPAYIPDPTCVEGYPHFEPACEQCFCSPSDADPPGCFDGYQLCFENPDPEFQRLCNELVTCAINARCTGASCLVPCGDQIDAASLYNGGAGTSECSGGDPTVNPCAASTQAVGNCTTNNCGAVNGGPCPTFM
jgi:hypothetical protein